MRRRQHGQTVALFAVALLACVGFVGLAVDGSRLFQAHLGAQVLADEAASAAAQRLDTAPGSALRAGGPPELVLGRSPGSALDAADSYLAERVTDDGHTSWMVSVRPREVDVVVHREVELTFLGAVGIGPQTVDAEGSATPVAGIIGPDQ